MQFTLFLSLLVISASAAFYNNDPQLANDLDTLDWVSNPGDVDWKGPLLFNNLWNALLKEQANQLDSDTEKSFRSDIDVKEKQEKRFSNDVQQKQNNKLPFVVSQRKWNNRKGKGLPPICYFKLCSFKTLKL